MDAQSTKHKIPDIFKTSKELKRQTQFAQQIRNSKCCGSISHTCNTACELTITGIVRDRYEKSNCLPDGPAANVMGRIFSGGITWPQENSVSRSAVPPADRKSWSRNSSSGCIVPPATTTAL